MPSPLESLILRDRQDPNQFKPGFDTIAPNTGRSTDNKAQELYEPPRCFT
jgi:hypothetical protein